MIKIPLEIGDIIRTGKFKNKRVEVKEIGTDEHRLPTVNGRGIMKNKIEKLMKTNETKKEGLELLGEMFNRMQKVSGRLINEANDGYNNELNTILEDPANNELKQKLSASEYNAFFQFLEKIDNIAPESAIDLDGYFPLDSLDMAIEYLEEYSTYFPRKIEMQLGAWLEKMKK